MKKEITDEEREIRGWIVDILCFLSNREATPEQLGELKERVRSAVRVFRKEGTAVSEAEVS